VLGGALEAAGCRDADLLRHCRSGTSHPRPRERWGTARRDCVPHRGSALLLRAWVAWVLGLSSFGLVVTGGAAVPKAWASHGLPSAPVCFADTGALKQNTVSARRPSG
jgi:hypothetical protein